MMNAIMATPFATALRWPAIVAAINALIAQVSGVDEGFSVFHLISIGAMVWAGWRVNRELWGNLKLAALAGPIVFIVGLVLVGGGLHLVFGDFSTASIAAAGTWAETWPRFAYLMGLVLASVLVAPITALISVAGGVLAEYF